MRPRFWIKVASGLEIHRLGADKATRLNLYRKTDLLFHPSHFSFLISFRPLLSNLQPSDILSLTLIFFLFFSCVTVTISFSQHCHSAISLHSKATYQRDWIILTDSVLHLAPQGCFSPPVLVFRLNTSPLIIGITGCLPIAGN